MPGRQHGLQDRWLSPLGKCTLMIICYPLQNQQIVNSFSNALTFGPNNLTVCLNVLTICPNALTISSNTQADCSYDLTVGLSNIWILLERGLWKSQVMNSTEVSQKFKPDINFWLSGNTLHKWAAWAILWVDLELFYSYEIFSNEGYMYM